MGKVYMGGGAGGGSYTAGAGIDITGNVISATGGQATTLQTVKVSLSSAQILNSFTTPIELIAAPGAGKMVNLISVSFGATYNSATYATNTTGRIKIGAVSATNLSLAFAASGQTYLALLATTIGDLENVNVNFSTDTGNPTAGDGTIDLYLSFVVITL